MVAGIEALNQDEREELVTEVMSDMKAQTDEIYNEGMTQLEIEMCLVLSNDRFSMLDIIRIYRRHNGDLEYSEVLLVLEEFYKSGEISEYPSSTEADDMVTLLNDTIENNVRHITEKYYGKS